MQQAKSEQQLQATQDQLRQTEMVLAQSQDQLQQTETLLAHYRTQLAQTEMVLTQFQAQLHQSHEELERSQSTVQRTQQELEQTTAQLQFAQRELERSHFQQAIADDPHTDSQAEYKYLVWEAWYAYRLGDLSQMVHYLQRSLKLSPCSRTETVVNWLESFAQFSSAKGTSFNAHHLSASPEWQQLVSRVLTVNKPIASLLMGNLES